MPVKAAIKTRSNEPNNTQRWDVCLATRIQAGISASYSTAPHRHSGGLAPFQPLRYSTATHSWRYGWQRAKMGKISWGSGIIVKTAMDIGRTSSCYDMRNVFISTLCKTRYLLLHISKPQPTDWLCHEAPERVVPARCAPAATETKTDEKIRSKRIRQGGKMEV